MPLARAIHQFSEARAIEDWLSHDCLRAYGRLRHYGHRLLKLWDSYGGRCLRLQRRRRGVHLESLDLIRGNFDVTACGVAQVKPRHGANHLPAFMPDGISIAKNGKVRRLRETDSSDDERSELERSRHREFSRFKGSSFEGFTSTLK